MMWFSTPCNPSGSVYNREELTALAAVLEKHPHVVIADEIYEHINFRNFAALDLSQACLIKQSL
jgi:aspartate aminotransferase